MTNANELADDVVLMEQIKEATRLALLLSAHYNALKAAGMPEDRCFNYTGVYQMYLLGGAPYFQDKEE
jgi:hypothetical protein